MAFISERSLRKSTVSFHGFFFVIAVVCCLFPCGRTAHNALYFPSEEFSKSCGIIWKWCVLSVDYAYRKWFNILGYYTHTKSNRSSIVKRTEKYGELDSTQRMRNSRSFQVHSAPPTFHVNASIIIIKELLLWNSVCVRVRSSKHYTCSYNNINDTVQRENHRLCVCK